VRFITAGPDGNLWFTEQVTGKIGRITPGGVITEYALPVATAQPFGIAAGPDGALWFTEVDGNKIGRITTSGAITEFALPTVGARPFQITPGPEGSNRMYFTQFLGDRIGIVTMTGAVTDAVTLPAGSRPSGIVTIGGSVWFTEMGTSNLARLVTDTTVARISLGAGVAPNALAAGPGSTIWLTSGALDQVWKLSDQGAVIGQYSPPTAASDPWGMAIGADGNMWVALMSADKVARVASGQVPVSTKTPEVGPIAPIVPGTVLTSTTGTWSYQPSTYAYQWQRCTTGPADCADIAGAAAATYTVAVDDNLKYLRLRVIATNVSGPSSPVLTGLIPVGLPTTPQTPVTPAPATGTTVAVGSGVSAVLLAPTSQRRGTSRTYRVTFTADLQGTVTFTFTTKGKVKKVKGIPVKAETASYKWKVPWSWRKGTTTVLALFTPATGSPYVGGNMMDTVRIR
jgi:streptogramin lyase